MRYLLLAGKVRPDAMEIASLPHRRQGLGTAPHSLLQL
jgi:hypothetical protein